MASYTWNGSVSGNLNVAANYTPRGLPTNADTLDIPATGVVNNISSGILDSNFPGTSVTNEGTIDGGTFFATVDNSGVVNNGTFKARFNNVVGGVVYNGTFNIGNTYNRGTIVGGTFTGSYIDNDAGIINGGTFDGDVTTNSGGTINDGTFNGMVDNRAAEFTVASQVLGRESTVYHIGDTLPVLCVLDAKLWLLKQTGKGILVVYKLSKIRHLVLRVLFASRTTLYYQMI